MKTSSALPLRYTLQSSARPQPRPQLAPQYHLCIPSMVRPLQSSRIRFYLPRTSSEPIDIDLLEATGAAVGVAKTVSDVVAVPGLPVVLEVLGTILEKAKVCA